MLAGAFSLSTGSKMSFFAGESPILRFSSPEDACIWSRVSIKEAVSWRCVGGDVVIPVLKA